MIHFKDNKNKSALSTRWAQMSKQEQIIEKKKMEIQAKLEAQKQAAALAAQAKLSNPTVPDDTSSPNIFSNDGSFMSQYKALLEKQNKENQEREAKDKHENEEKEVQKSSNEKEERFDSNSTEVEKQEFKLHSHDGNEKRTERSQRERHRRWNDRGRNRPHSPMTPVIEDRKKVVDTSNIPPLMQLSVRPPDDNSLSPGSYNNPWESRDRPSPNDEFQMKNQQDSKFDNQCLDSDPMGSRSIGSGPMGFGPMGSGPLISNSMGPGPLGPGPMGPRSMGSGPMGPGPMGPGPMGPGQSMPTGSNSGPIMGPGGPNMPPMHPFMGGPPNYPMPPNFMRPNGPGGGPGPIPPNMCGPNMRGPGPNGPNGPIPFFPPFNNSPMSKGPLNSMRMPFGPNGPNFGPHPPFGPNGPNFGPNNVPPIGPPNMRFRPPNSLPPNAIPEPLDNISPPDSLKLQNVPPHMPFNQVPKPKDMEAGISSPHPMQVLSADSIPPSVQRAAAEVATNGDHWENVLKAIQDQNMWFLHNTNSNEYKAYRNLVTKLRKEGAKPEIKPEDKYEPEFSLEDDDSNDTKPIYQETGDSYDYPNQYNSSVKREQTSSQSDDESDSKKERRRRKKSRWGNEPPVDIKPPGIVAPLPNTVPPPLPGAKLPKIEEEGLKLTSVNRNNQALMQYAMTNYGTTNLSAEDWQKCEDNFKLNLLYQDMLKKRQECERLAAAGKHRYEYDSDEDTADGTWEHKLRSKEMNATERWATELTKQAEGKHHIGDFLPPEELKKFMEKYSAAKGGKEPDFSDYKEYKLKEDNLGFKMLQKLGWNEGEGLGAEGTGIVEPINKGKQPVANLGLGASTSDVVSPDDDEFDAYRKRMMLAYRFRPNPLNNPRRPYY